MAKIFELPLKDGNITTEKAHNTRQMQLCDKTAYIWGLRYQWDSSLSRKPLPCFPHFMPPCPQHILSVVLKKGFTHLELSITCSKSFVCNIKTIIPQIIYYALSHVFCCVLCLAGVHCGQRGSSVGRYSWSGRVSRPEDTGSFFSTNNSMVINNVLKSDLREVNNKVW